MKERGDYGETCAVHFLKKQGYKILEKNFRTRFGEIDIVAKKNEYIVFVEVKLRKNNDFGGGASAVDARKQNRIKKTAAIYLSKFNEEYPVRFDVVIITCSGEKIRKEDIEVIENAFW